MLVVSCGPFQKLIN